MRYTVHIIPYNTLYNDYRLLELCVIRYYIRYITDTVCMLKSIVCLTLFIRNNTKYCQALYSIYNPT